MLGVGRAGPCGRDDTDPVGGPSSGVEPAGVGPDERDAWIVLNEAEGVGPVSFGRLLSAFGTASAVLQVAARPGGTAELVRATVDGEGSAPRLTPAAAHAVAALARDPEPVLGPVRRAGLRALLLVDEDFPSRLRRIELPPPVLYVRGSIAALDRARSIAIVGTRRPTEVGRGTAARIADAVAGLGATVVSGLAFGIDAAAHRAAIGAHGPTVAVIGGGHERLYPAGHRGLAELIVAGDGAVISEFAPEVIPSRGTFPRRNRIISGLADATVVVEAGVRSGALTTAAWALEQSRGLYIVPGRLDDPAVAGSLAFLREAGPEARVVAGIPELLDDLGLLGTPYVKDASRTSSPRDGLPGVGDGRSRALVTLAPLAPVERAVALAVRDGRSGVDELVAATGLAGATVLGVLTSLEVRGLVVEAFGRYRAAGALASDARRSPAPRVRPSPRQRAAADGDGSHPGRAA
jgi:DNA processing protein